MRRRAAYCGFHEARTREQVAADAFIKELATDIVYGDDLALSSQSFGST